MVPVLLIEDLAPTALFQTVLRRRGYPTERLSCADEALSYPAASPGIVIIRTGTQVSGTLGLIPRLRARWSDAAIVVLAETAREADALAVLSAGADDFHPLPIALQEFLYRLDRLAAARSSRPLCFAGATLSLSARTASMDGHSACLTPLEAALLGVLMRAAGAT